MCGTVNKIGGAINDFSKSTVGKVIAPTFTIPANLINKALPSLTPAKQLGIGAGVGAGVMALGSVAPGAMASANGMLPGAAGAANGMGGISGSTAALGPGGAGVMAQSGGVPLLTKVLLGTSVATTLAGYFGRKDPTDYRNWFNGLNAEDQSQVKALEEQLIGLQTNLEARNQAVQKVVDDYPNVVQQIAKQRAASGEEFDQITKQYMDHAIQASSAKLASTGALSSGAANEAAAKVGGDMALKKLDYMGSREEAARSDIGTGWQARLNETEALRSFQQKMLGMGVDQRFSAAQNSLTRRSGQLGSLAGINAQQETADNQATQGLFGSLGSTLGTAAMLPMYQQLFSPNKAQALPNAPAAGTSVPFGQGAPRLNMPLNNDKYANNWRLSGGY